MKLFSHHHLPQPSTPWLCSPVRNHHDPLRELYAVKRSFAENDVSVENVVSLTVEVGQKLMPRLENFVDHCSHKSPTFQFYVKEALSSKTFFLIFDPFNCNRWEIPYLLPKC